MSKTQTMILHSTVSLTRRKRCPTRAHPCRVFSIALLALSIFAPAEVSAQQRFARTYPARDNVRLELKNRSGTIEVVGWKRNEIKISADMEAPAARFTPTLERGGLVIDVVNDTRGREDVGDVNFKIQVPFNSNVDLQTTRGNITVRNVQGSLVRARVTTEGDIELTGIRTATVMAENTLGNILFDAELMRGGSYQLNSTQGDINIRITAGSGFMLTAMAPRTRNINLGGLANIGSFDFQSGNRRVVGRVGDGGAQLITTNLRGSIAFSLR